MPNQIPNTNPPAILKTRQLATNFFGANNMMPAELSAVPRYKFMFYARFIADADATTLYPWMTKLGSSESGVSFKIKTIDKPKVELTTVELNQYNRKRHAYTKVEYQPFTIRMHDTVDNSPLHLWKDYFIYYFGDSRANKSSYMNESTVIDKFGDSTGWGLRPLSEDISFFSRIELYSIYGKKYTQVNYLNPKITTVDWTQYDASSSEPDEMSMTFKYEALEYKDEAPIDDTMATLFGFNTGTPVLDSVPLVGAGDDFKSKKNPSAASVYASFTNNAANKTVLNTDRSVVTGFGLNSGAYEQFVNMRDQQSSATTTYVPPSINSFGLNNYSNDAGISQSILGIPNGALPRVTVQISGSATLSSLPAVGSPLSAYGTFNFGSF